MGKGDFVKGAIFLVISYLYVDYLKHDERPIVNTENGKVRGVIHTADDNRGRYKAFKGIPYAKNPANELRFEPPEPPESWSGVRDAGYYRSQCISMDILFSKLMLGQEDCLFLNVFVPIISHTYPLPVLVLFHGGYWHLGSSQDHGEHRLISEDVILVTLNYRLGALGFLSTGDSVVRGNQGLKDQVMALKWIRSNIEQFGGDADRLTIFGESAGGAAVHLHILSPASNYLFHRAISQSGTALNPFATYSKVRSQAKRFASKFNCPTNNTVNMVRCLKSIDASTLVYAHKEAFDIFRHRQMLFGPTVETINDSQAFLVEDPIKILERGDFPKIDLIIGVNAQEGSILTSAMAINETKYQIVQDWKNSYPVIFQYPKNDETSSKIHNFYFKNLPSNASKEDYLRNLTDAISDRMFFHACSRSAKLYSNHTKTYLYYFNYRAFISLKNFVSDNERLFHPVLGLLWNQFWRTVQEFVFGWPVISDAACHGDELSLLFTHAWTPAIFSVLPERDKKISTNIVRLWTAFAKSWDKLIIDKVTWEPTNPQHNTLRYLEISNNPSMIDEPFAERMKFWDSIYKNIPEQ